MIRGLAAFLAIPVLVCVLASAILMEPVGVFLCGIVALFFTGAGAITWIGFFREKQRSPRPVLTGAGLAMGLIVSVMVTHWPLRLVYLVSRPSMEQLADEIPPGWRPPIQGRRAGLISVRAAVRGRKGVVCLWTDTKPGGNSGFVRCGRDPMPFNLFSSISLDDRWQFIAED